jgi:hypothetical protein
MGIYTLSGGKNAYCERFLVDLAGGFCPFWGLYFACKEEGRRGRPGTVRRDGMSSFCVLFRVFLVWSMHHTEFSLEMGDLKYDTQNNSPNRSFRQI